MKATQTDIASANFESKKNKHEHPFKYYDHLGSCYPYYYLNNNKLLSVTINEIISQIPENERYLDPVGIVEIVNKGHLLGNRTLIEGVKKSPWMARPDGRGDWEYASLPAHENLVIPAEKTAKAFKLALEKEALGYLEGKKRVGILLSGGLDSRIVAGIVRKLQISGDFSGEVIGITWGIDNCRDIVYAQEIVKRFNWEWIHYPLGPEILLENIRVAGLMGAEFSPFHLHAMPRIAKEGGFDAILVGNYGDGIGRSEFSGTHVKNLRPTIPANLNRHYLFNRCFIKCIAEIVQQDAWGYRKNIKRKEEFEYREIEYFMHCIRRRSQGSISIISKNLPIYQLFTAPKTYSLIWRLDPTCRNNDVYKIILKDLPARINEIPWARTGYIFESNCKNPDIYSKNHHKYGLWIRNELANYVQNLINSEEIAKLAFINKDTYAWLMKNWNKSSKTITINKIDEIVGWLAALAIFLKEYKIKCSYNANQEIGDKLLSKYGAAKIFTYQKVRDIVR